MNNYSLQRTKLSEQWQRRWLPLQIPDHLTCRPSLKQFWTSTQINLIVVDLIVLWRDIVTYIATDVVNLKIKWMPFK